MGPTDSTGELTVLRLIILQYYGLEADIYVIKRTHVFTGAYFCDLQSQSNLKPEQCFCIEIKHNLKLPPTPWDGHVLMSWKYDLMAWPFISPKVKSTISEAQSHVNSKGEKWQMTTTVRSLPLNSALSGKLGEHRPSLWLMFAFPAAQGLPEWCRAKG